MGWYSLFGDADEGEAEQREPSDPFGRIVAEPVFDAFREAWKAGAGLFNLFGEEPVKIKERVGPDAPNRRPDVAKVETFLDRTGHLDLARTEGPTGYYGSRVDQGVRAFHAKGRWHRQPRRRDAANARGAVVLTRAAVSAACRVIS